MLWLLAFLPSGSAQQYSPQYATVKVGKVEVKHVGPQLVSDELIRSNIRVKPGNEYPSPFALQAALSGFLGLVMPYIKMIKLVKKIISGIIKTNQTRKNLAALKAAYQGSKSKAQGGDAVAQTVYESGKYGFKKVRRQFAERIAKIVIAIVKFATIITDLVTGGTAVLFTSIRKRTSLPVAGCVHCAPRQA